MPTQIQIKRGSTIPAGLTVGEQAVNTNTNQIYLGSTGGTVWVGGEVTAGIDMGSGSAVSATRVPTQSGVYNYVRNNFVTSFNGLTGAVTGVTVGGANTFTALNSFNAGISAAGGVTLSGTLSGATATFSRLVTGNGGFSGNVNISSTNATGNMYPVLSRGAGVTALFVDSATTPLVYQPFLGNLGLKGITLASGSDVLNITSTQITATSTSAPESAFFYFVSPSIYFETGFTSALAAQPNRQLVWGDIYNNTENCYFGVNRAESGLCGDYAVEINHSTGKALQLIYNDYSGAATNWVNMNVTSGGDLTITPSGGDVTVSGNLSADSFILSSGGIKALTGTTYSFLAADNGKIITMSNAGGITAAIPTGLPVGFSVTVIQLGAGQVGFSADAGVTLNSYNSLKKIIGQHGSASVVIYSSNTANLAGSLT